MGTLGEPRPQGRWVNKAAGSDFNPGPESFTTAAPVGATVETQVGSVRGCPNRGGEKTNGSGDAIASDLTRGGTPQDV